MNFIGICIKSASVVSAVKCLVTVNQTWSKNIMTETYVIQNYNFAYHFVWVCETWLLTLREERRLRMFDGRVMRGLFGCKRN
jgi:hypothetical protein